MMKPVSALARWPRAIALCVLAISLTASAQARLDMSAEAIGYNTAMPYCYIRITATNRTGHTIALRAFSLTDHSGREIEFRNQALKAGETRTWDVAAPPPPASYYRVRCIDSDGTDNSVNVENMNQEKFFLNIDQMRNWAEEKDQVDFTTALGISSSTYGSTSYSAVNQIEAHQLPDNWLCLTPFRAVFISDYAFRRASPSARAALLKYVDAGGSLTVYNAAEFEQRASLMGSITHQQPNPVKTKQIRGEWRRAGASWTNQYGGGDMGSFPYLVKETGGRAGALIFATLFVVLAGPVNYFYFRRRNRIRMLLVSLPAISICFCMLMTVYFIVTQGFQKRGGTFSVTFLDESTDSAITLSRHCLYSGLYPLGGFKFERDAGFYPLRKLENRRDSFSFDFTEGQQLKSGIFKPSFNFHYFTARPEQTRERLIYDRDEGTVTNGFEAPIRAVCVLDGAMRLQAGALQPGESAKLEPFDQREFLNDILSVREQQQMSNLTAMGGPGLDQAARDEKTRYVICFETEEPSDEAGTSIKNGTHTRVLHGVMEGEAVRESKNLTEATQ